MRAISLLLVTCLVLAFSGCGKSGHPIVGKWKIGTGDGMIWEFHENGAAITGNTRGKYMFGDKNRIKIQTPRATFVYQVEFTGDRMIWNDPNGTRMELTRVQ